MGAATSPAPAKASAPPPKPMADLTMMRDPVEIWPDPMDCPDYPLVLQGVNPDGPYSRDDAQDALRRLSGILNGKGPLRAPTDVERAEALEQYFEPAKRGIRFPDQAAFGARGFAGLIPARGDKRADLIARAVHLRGYLRKLDALAEQRAQAAQDRQDSAARRKVAAWAGYIAGLEAEAKGLADGAARYHQFLADKRAFYRLMTLRGEVSEVLKEATAAAAELGEDAPVMPSWIDELCKYE